MSSNRRSKEVIEFIEAVEQLKELIKLLPESELERPLKQAGHPFNNKDNSLNQPSN